MGRRKQLRCCAMSQGDAADSVLCWDYMRPTTGARCTAELCTALHVDVNGVPLCGRACGKLLGFRSRGVCGPDCPMAHPDNVATCLAAALEGSGFELQPTEGGAHMLVAAGGGPGPSGCLPVPQALMLAIDYGYDTLMSPHGLASLATQTTLCHHLCKQHGEHVRLALSGHGQAPGGAAAAHLQAAGAEAWALRRHDSLAAMSGAEGGAPLVYLSPDAKEPLGELEPGSIYVIGALVDRRVIAGASLARAADHGGGCVVRRLPLKESLPTGALAGLKMALNLTTVVHCLIEWTHCRDWRTALLRGLGAEQRRGADLDGAAGHKARGGALAAPQAGEDHGEDAAGAAPAEGASEGS